ncbi:Uncharacterized protein Adt_46574 [Abeliophyllum distichum]|uniref:Uncharacterized protein n=1 Tax=Abeliophyllum distichum TaxID=126358 RepID=A0ABD1NZ72_9LAMI
MHNKGYAKDGTTVGELIKPTCHVSKWIQPRQFPRPVCLTHKHKVPAFETLPHSCCELRRFPPRDGTSVVFVRSTPENSSQRLKHNPTAAVFLSLSLSRPKSHFSAPEIVNLRALNLTSPRPKSPFSVPTLLFSYLPITPAPFSCPNAILDACYYDFRGWAAVL